MWQTAALAILHAALFVLAFPPVNLFPLAALAPAPLAWLAINSRTTRRAVLVVFTTQVFMWLWLKQWLIHVSLLGYPILACYMSAYPVLFVWLIRRASQGNLVKRWPMTLVVPICWVACEYLRGTVVAHGYPWFLVAHPLVEWPVLVQSADIAGAYFVSLLAVSLSGLVVDVMRARAGNWGRKPLVGCVIAVALIHAGNVGYGLWRMGQKGVLWPGPNLLVIQTNQPQSNRIEWTPEEQENDCIAFFRQTIKAAEAEASAGRPGDLIVWPETMLPGWGLEPQAVEFLTSNTYWPGDMFSSGIAALSERVNAPMLVGSPAFLGLRVEDGYFRWDKRYNSAYLVDGRPPYQRYDKTFLTPFGETMPYISNWTWLEQRLLALGAPGMTFDLDSNPDPELIEVFWEDEPLAIPTPICFEDTVAEVCRSLVYRDGGKPRAVMVNLSNDGWFGDYASGRVQHAQIARFRCIENRVPMVRAANTGLSVAIDSNGCLVGRIGEKGYGEAKRAGRLASSPQLDERRTLYGSIGDSWAWISPATAAVILGLSYRNRKTAKG